MNACDDLSTYIFLKENRVSASFENRRESIYSEGEINGVMEGRD